MVRPVISHAKFMGGSYDPTATATFEESGRVIIVPSGHASTLNLPLGYAQFVEDTDAPTVPKRHTGGPCFYVINNTVSTLTVKSSGSSDTLFTVAANSIALVAAGATAYSVITTRAKNTGQAYAVDPGRGAVTAPSTKTILTDDICGNPVFKLTPCAAGSVKYVEDEDLWTQHIGKAVFVDSLWYTVSRVEILPEGESLEDLGTTVDALLDSCPVCNFGPGTRFNGYIASSPNLWVRLQPIATGGTLSGVSERACYQLWIYENVSHNGTLYDLSTGSPTITALRTAGSANALKMLDNTYRHAYMPQYPGWRYISKTSGVGIPTGAELTAYPYKWSEVGAEGGSIGGYEIDPLNPSMEFDAAQRTLIYDTMIADYDGAPDIAPGSGVGHTLILYVRCNSVIPRNKRDGAGWISNFRNGWQASTAYPLNDEIRPGCNGSTTQKQVPTSRFAFRATTAGTSGGSQPNWSTVTDTNQTINDGTIVWTSYPVNYLLTQRIYILSAHAACSL